LARSLARTRGRQSLTTTDAGRDDPADLN